MKGNRIPEKDPNQSGNIPIRSTLKAAEDVSQNAELSTDLPRVDGSRRIICFSITDLACCQLAAILGLAHSPPPCRNLVRERGGRVTGERAKEAAARLGRGGRKKEKILEKQHRVLRGRRCRKHSTWVKRWRGRREACPESRKWAEQAQGQSHISFFFGGGGIFAK